MKALKTWLMTIAVLLCSTTVRAYDFEVDGINYNITSDANLTVEVTDGGVYTGIVVIPEYVTYDNKNYSVASIGVCAFSGCTELTHITIPNSVKSIKLGAFQGCTSLTNIIIPNSVTSIWESAFQDCTGLTNITIPNSVKSIEGGAFSGCTSLPVENNIRYADSWAVDVTDNTLSRYTLRENTIGLAGTFYNCTSLVRITLPSSLRYISDIAFENCNTLKSLTLPEGVSIIGYRAFYDCTSLSEINIPSGVTNIGMYAFYNCSLTEISIPKGITEIEEYSFFYNDFSIVEIPEGVISIGNNAFLSCSKLESVNLPQSLTSIGNDAFHACSSLSSITIPESVTSIGSSAFTNLKSVTLNSPTILSEGGFAGKFGNYVTEYIIGVDAEEIKDYTFYNSTALKSITLPETLTTIGEGAFEECVSLDSITIPADVTEIKDYAFSNCIALKYICSEALVPPTCGTTTFDGIDTENCILEVPASAANAYAITAPWSDFNIKVSLVDGEDYENETDTEIAVITYTRTLNNLKWNALYLPFEVPMESLVENYDVAYVNSMHSYDYEDDGVLDSMTMEVVKIKEGILHANHPYLIRAKNEAAKAMNIVVENSTLYAAESVTLDCSSVYTRFEITGIYNPMTSAELDGCYALSGGTWMKLADGSTLNPFRLYLRITDREGSPVKIDSASPALYSVGIRVRGEGSATGIEEHRVESADAPVYDLMGRRVTNPQKGHLYIVNGKKVIF